MEPHGSHAWTRCGVRDGSAGKGRFNACLARGNPVTGQFLVRRRLPLTSIDNANIHSAREGDPMSEAKQPLARRRGRRLAGVIALALALVAGGVGITRLTARNSVAAVPPAPPPSVPVSSLTVTSRSIDLVRTGLGVATAWNTATMTPQVSGALVDLPFQEGARVNQGDVIARIDPK